MSRFSRFTQTIRSSYKSFDDKLHSFESVSIQRRATVGAIAGGSAAIVIACTEPFNKDASMSYRISKDSVNILTSTTVGLLVGVFSPTSLVVIPCLCFSFKKLGDAIMKNKEDKYNEAVIEASKKVIQLDLNKLNKD